MVTSCVTELCYLRVQFVHFWGEKYLHSSFKTSVMILKTLEALKKKKKNMRILFLEAYSVAERKLYRPLHMCLTESVWASWKQS